MASRGHDEIELFLKEHGNLAPKRYKYSDLKKMTNSFRDSLGRGGFGSVYKGRLADGGLVAVKTLNVQTESDGAEFVNEVASISRTSHVNVVNLLGFCLEGSKRALIYEFMPNGSLEKYIRSKCVLGWEKMFGIMLGVARGLDYLHQGCNTRILHFDIKPHNILLDKDFNPKISDFGLAKLCPNRSSVVSLLVARGTIGYIAPELVCMNFGDVSYKSDVYSYGMMVLEIAVGKRNINYPRDVSSSSEMYFPHYIYKQLEEEEVIGDCGIDENITTNEGGGHQDILMKRKLIIVGLWCVQTNPKDRPSMSKVVEMLEGKLESLEIPPKPSLSTPPQLTLHFSTSSL
ncbi:receptor serine/threonine kinase- putative [Striga hermonthica]|uniref:Receptor serine/threonine kinase- putative n=1 Tax=Striga hermonthica TaxID=68872 RepID=A0A9N7RFJ1_STRHE|nr:receptor serine/threonine kinase- putative [Striga hermonthica]